MAAEIYAAGPQRANPMSPVTSTFPFVVREEMLGVAKKAERGKHVYNKIQFVDCVRTSDFETMNQRNCVMVQCEKFAGDLTPSRVTCQHSA
jgi:hypothetical protein